MATTCRHFSRPSKRPKPRTGKPQLIIATTLIGKGIPEVAGTAKAHGEGGAKFVDAARKALGLPENEHFFVSAETRAYFAEHGKKLAAELRRMAARLYRRVASRESGARQGTRRRA